MPGDETDECIHLMYPASSCTICNPTPKEEVEDKKDGRVISAIYDGHCPECNLLIYPQQTIKRKNRKWMHKRCADRLVTNQS